jgi:hypothetical protein
MTKMVIVVDESAPDVESLAREVAAIPGVSVTGRSDAFIDVNADAKGAVAELRKLTENRAGVSLHPVAEPKLMEPIRPNKFL